MYEHFREGGCWGKVSCYKFWLLEESPGGSLLGELRGLQESRRVESWAGLQSWTRCGAVYS